MKIRPYHTLSLKQPEMFRKMNFKVLIIFLVTLTIICPQNTIAAVTSSIPISGTISNAGKIPPTPADDLPNQSTGVINSFPIVSSTSRDINPSSTVSSTSTSMSSNANRIGSGVFGISVIVGVFGWFIGVNSL
ncbi:3366_t:CDS:2 [Acaulospora colombiana]|uniref:3366_t:CDS:1 n=1 Tax=Acaulospora colombiana TaxID=27376 RepID=A0ACA9JW70_9GLOM|nr:3366_t:CDS:2 [Acaulospora colombiana]